jgi:hypothetical protein
VTLACLPGDVRTVDFVLERIATRDKPRSVGFWKHQVNAALKGKQKGVKVTAPELIQLFAAIHERFDPYFSIFIPVVTLEDFKAVLSPKKPSPAEKAKRQFAALLLNVVSNRLSTWQFVSEDKATLSQAISYIAELIEDTDPSNDELAKDIAEKIIEEETIPAGVIPLTVPQIAFTQPSDGEVTKSLRPRLIADFINYPNPSNPVTTISYRLEREVPVDLAIYNALGQKVRDLVRGSRQQGLNYVVWDGTDNSGRPVASGVYFCRLKAGACAATRRLLLVR